MLTSKHLCTHLTNTPHSQVPLGILAQTLACLILLPRLEALLYSFARSRLKFPSQYTCTPGLGKMQATTPSSPAADTRHHMGCDWLSCFSYQYWTPHSCWFLLLAVFWDTYCSCPSGWRQRPWLTLVADLKTPLSPVANTTGQGCLHLWSDWSSWHQIHLWQLPQLQALQAQSL